MQPNIADIAAEQWMLVRFRVGRTLIHAGLKAMPHGRVRRELHRLLEQWSEQVRKHLEESQNA